MVRRKRSKKKARRKKQPSRWQRWRLRLFLVVAAGVLASIALVLPLRWFDPLTSRFMLADDSGREPLLHEWVDWGDIGAQPVLAVVGAEDQRFADHFGIDLAAIQDSISEQDERGRLRGASTISQQTAKNLWLWSGRSVARKGLEAWFTLVLEACLPKRRILEIYLNIAEFGPGIYGIGAASRYYFGVPPGQLNRSQAALLAAVLPSPRRYRVSEPSDFVRERQAWIRLQMQRLEREGWITRL